MKERILTNSFRLKKSITYAGAIFIFITVFAIFVSLKPATSIAKESSEIIVENSQTKMGNIIPIKVKANAIGSDKCFVLTLSSVGAGLSDEYSFDENDKTEITDDNGKKITLNRYIADDGAVNYWFELEGEESSEFSLKCTSGIYVATKSDINDYEPKTTIDENGKEIALSESEIIERVKSEKQAQNANSEKIEMRVFFGSGENFDRAMKDSSEREDFLLEWNVAKGKMLAMRSSFTGVEKYVDGGAVTDTASWTYTKNDITGTSTLTISGTGPIPNYSSRKDTPWVQKGYLNVTKLVIEDGITVIGDNAFSNVSILSDRSTELYIGNTVTEIRSQALAMNNFSNIVIPGSVKNLGYAAFLGNRVKIDSLILEEGVENIGATSFGSCYITKLKLPSSIKSIFPNDISVLEEISIGDNNDNGTYFVKDNVLFKRLDNGEVQLVWYPAKKADKEYTIPSFVTNLNCSSAFIKTTNLEKVTIPATVTSKINSQWVFNNSSVEEITVEEGVVIENAWFFDNATNLRKLSIHDGNIIGNYPYYHGGNLLEEIYIPSTVTGILDHSLALCTPNLQKVYFDAKYVSGYQSQQNRANKYELTIGKNVDKIVTSKHGSLITGFKTILKNALTDKILFVGPNQIDIINPEFEDMPTPLNTLYGTIWVDEQGVVYKYDKTTLTASVAYVPYGLKNVTIPKTITPETDVNCIVNEVGKDAFKLAVDLTSVNFADPSVVEIINPYGFANCSKLGNINGADSEEKAAESFTNPNIKIGIRAFINTALKSESGNVKYSQSMNGKNIIRFENDDNFSLYVNTKNTGEWIANGNYGGYKFLTGQNANINIQMQQRTYEDVVYRIYFEFSDPEGVFSIGKGQSLEFDNAIKAECFATDVENICYVDFTNYAGSTATALLTANYISPTSSGGELKIWGFKLTKEQAESQKGTIVDCVESKDFSDSIQSYWTTKADDFITSKEKAGNAKLYLIGDGKGNVLPDNNITWKVKFKRKTDETLSDGKDFVKSVDFYDYVVLPEYFSWNPEVISAIKSGDIRTSSNKIYVGDMVIATIGQGYNFNVEWSDEHNTLLFHWRRYNTNEKSEIGLSDCDFTISKETIYIDSGILNQATVNELSIMNNIYSVVHYTYTADKQTDIQQAEAKFILKEAELQFSKGVLKRPKYLGETTTYTICLKNTGAAAYVDSEKTSYRIYDELPNLLYIKPENIEKMLNDEFGKKLKVTICDAMLSKSKTAVKAYDGKTAYKNAANSDDMDYTTDKLIISWNGDNIQLATESKIYKVTDNLSLKDIFDELGFYNVNKTKYIVEWTLNDSNECYKLNGGSIQNYIIYSNTKDTFQLIDTNDKPVEYSNKFMNIHNMAFLYKKENVKVRETYMSQINEIRSEAILNKLVYAHGQSEPLEDNFNVPVNQVLDNLVTFNHYGDGTYDNLPMVDDISGTQSLLVSVEDNMALSSMGLSKVTVDSKEYYKLNKPGTYRNVVVGVDDEGTKFIADTIKVSKSTSGLDTKIKWYFSHLEGERYYINLNYETIVDLDVFTSTRYNVSNTIWMNDKKNDRLYASVFGGGSLLDFNKKIVYKNNDGTYTVDDDDYSDIKVGESVYYRLAFFNKNNFDITVTGDNILDNLPTNGGFFSWEKDKNVSLSWQETEGVIAENLDSWSIEKDSNDSTAQTIKWSSDTSITLQANKNFYIYVKLDFPSDATIWKNYCSYMKGNKLYNTFIVYDYPSYVSHGLIGKGEALLQKGVYSTLKYSINGSNNIKCVETSSRVYYNNRDYTNRAIMYYVVLYNNGDNRLYLNDMQDKLPEGFTYLTMNSGNSPIVNQTLSDTMITSDNSSNFLVNIKNSSTDDIKFLSVNVNCEKNNDGTLSFKFSKIEQKDSAVKYDEIRNKLYLEKGEAIAFSYVCDIGLIEDSYDKAVNTIGMNYYDYLNADVNSVSSDDVSVNGKLNDEHMDQNDGTRAIDDAKNVHSKYGFNGSGKWLISNVTVSRGGISPGITNYTDSYVDTNGNIIRYVTDAPPQAVVNWRVRMHNSGFSSITDYTITDTLPIRYSLTGSLSLKMYDNTQTSEVKKFENFITILSERTKTDDSIRIRSNYNNNECTIPFDGTEVIVPISDNNGSYVNISISISKNDKGQEVLSIRFADKGFSIPEEGGYVDLSLSSVNVTGQIVNTVYTNTAVLIPNKQSFSSTTQGSLVYDSDGKTLIGVTNNSPLNISFGALTSSIKEVFEINNTDNKTDSNQEKNYITLNNKKNEFRYTLSVKNETNSTMKRLVLIDTLPKLNDTSPFDSTALRGSEFAVHLSENPNFVVKITYSNGNTKTLESSEYTIGFKKDSSLTSSDWKGVSTWSESSENAEAVRLIINDENLVENKAVVEISFNAKADDGAIAGQKAWNSFGYHYILNDSQKTELEAMPLSVGVQITETPMIQKTLVDIEGNTYTVKQDTTFSFLVYKGEKYSGKYSTADELIQALENNNTPYQKIDLTVLSGKSFASKKLDLEYDKLKWINGQKYTIVELPTDDIYELNSWNYISQNSMTFTYSYNKNQVLLCNNRYNEWSAEITKVDDEDSEIKLEGAIFAIYSPVQSDQLSDSEYEALDFSPDKVIVYNDKTWYISGVQTTNSEGKATFDKLLRDEYCIKEICSPEGYILTAEPKIVTNNSLIQKIEIVNRKLPVLPETGNKGIAYFISFGMGVLLVVAGFMFINKLKATAKIK